jgi:hypothetical protein
MGGERGGEGKGEGREEREEEGRGRDIQGSRFWQQHPHNRVEESILVGPGIPPLPQDFRAKPYSHKLK